MWMLCCLGLVEKKNSKSFCGQQDVVNTWILHVQENMANMANSSQT